MTQTFKMLLTAVAVSLIASAAAAGCTVEYKAKQDNPLRLEHGTLELSGSCEGAEGRAKVALAARGWTLLKVLSVSGS